jgi:gas vesicle protein
MDEQARRSRTRSFLVGAAVGASAALAAARRGRPKHGRVTPAGLAAFEEAPCYRELVEKERRAP